MVTPLSRSLCRNSQREITNTRHNRQLSENCGRIRIRPASNVSGESESKSTERSQMPSMKEHSTNGRSTGNGRALNVEAAVRERYSGAAQQAEAALCCPVEYDTRYLEIIPEEVLERDYGCGDPSRHVAPGEVVLDLGSGGGKICFIAAQIVGSAGRVIGIDCNDAMLDLARRHQPTVAQRLGFDNIEFRKGKIQDLQLNLQLLDEYLQLNPATDSSDWLRVTEQADHLRESHPLVADGSVDVVVSNCVLNLVREDDRRALFSELHRVLKRGGRAVSAILSPTKTFLANCNAIRSCGAAASVARFERIDCSRPSRRPDSTASNCWRGKRSPGPSSRGLNSAA